MLKLLLLVKGKSFFAAQLWTRLSDVGSLCVPAEGPSIVGERRKASGERVFKTWFVLTYLLVRTAPLRTVLYDDRTAVACPDGKSPLCSSCIVLRYVRTVL